MMGDWISTELYNNPRKHKIIIKKAVNF
jgi:hypothetical protein